MPRLPSFLRRHQPGPIVGSATRVQLDQPGRARKQLGKRQPWQEQCWTYFDVVPEVKTSTWMLGNAVARVRLVIAAQPRTQGGAPILASDPESGLPPAFVQACEDDLARLRGPLGGQAEILREIEMNVKVAGECYLVGWGAIEPSVSPLGAPIEGRPESWDVRSISEVVVKGSGDAATYIVRDDPTDKGVELNRDTDTIVRIWRRHPRWSNLADCELNGVRGECEALVTLHAELLADSRSRHNAGIITLPNELSFGAPPDEGEDGGDSADADPLMDELSEVFSDPVDDPLEPGAVAPAGLRGPAEFLKPDVLRWMDLGRKPSSELDNRITARVVRLARGLGLPVEKVMGHQGTTFANAAQVDEDEFTDWVEPDVQLIVDALTVGFMRPNMLDAGWPAELVEQVMVWYDPADAIRDPDMGDAADKAWDRNEISGEGYRKLRGIPDDMAPEPLELLVRAGLKRGIFTADLSLALLNLMGLPISVEPIPKAPALDAGAPVDAQASAMAAIFARHPDFAASTLTRRLERADVIVASGRPKAKRTVMTGLGRNLMDLDANLRSRLLVLADRTVDRALEKAGNRLRSQASFRPLLVNVPSQRAGAHIGHALVADAGLTPGDLLAGAIDPMREQFMAWGSQAQADAIELVSRTVGGFDAARRADLQLRQAQSLDEAWSWLQQALVARAEQMLFDPSAAAPAAVGEVAADVSVPPGIVREALAIAGGSPPVATRTGSDAWVTLSAEQWRGGIGTGDLALGVLRDDGYDVEAYEWVYGPGGRSRPFEPHQELDGIVFTDWSDSQLAVTGSFPDGAYYLPGDHGGCLCDVAPVIVAPDGTTTVDV